MEAKKNAMNELEYNEKMEVTNNIKELTVDKLGKVVEIIKNKCSKAFKDIDGENCSIYIDNLD